MVIRATPVARTMLRWEFRSLSKASTWAYCTALASDAGTNRAWYPHALHWYLGCPPLRTVAAEVFAAAARAQVLRINHTLSYCFTLQ